MIPLKSEKDLALLRSAGKILSRITQRLQASVGAGMTTEEIDRLAGSFIEEEKVLPAFKGYKGFPSYICASVNEEIVHGIPNKRKLVSGDILSIDLGIIKEGYFSDMAVTVPIGEITEQKKQLLEVTSQALSEGIKRAVINNRLGDISNAIQIYVERFGFSIVRQFVGHGIGTQLHEEPEIPNFGKPNQGEILKAGMVLAIEPMVNIGTWECRILSNGWTAVTKDGQASAHFEHTVAITESGPEILTQ